MPVRVNLKAEPITRERIKGNPVTLPKAVWDNIDETVGKCEEWNAQILGFISNIKKDLDTRGVVDVEIEPKRLKSPSDEPLLMVKITPRNYLSYEAIQITQGTKTVKYYFGNFASLEKVRNLIEEFLIKEENAELE